MKTQADIHDNPDWQTVGAYQYNVAAPSGRIWHALAAMRVFEKQPNMNLTMGIYRGRDGEICYACCGGAARSVIEGWLTPKTFVVEWSEFEKHADADVNNYESSLNYFRMGSASLGFEEMGLDTELGRCHDRMISNFSARPKAFYRDMNKLASDLFAGGW